MKQGRIDISEDSFSRLIVLWLTNIDIPISSTSPMVTSDDDVSCSVIGELQNTTSGYLESRSAVLKLNYTQSCIRLYLPYGERTCNSHAYSLYRRQNSDGHVMTLYDLKRHNMT